MNFFRAMTKKSKIVVPLLTVWWLWSSMSICFASSLMGAPALPGKNLSAQSTHPIQDDGFIPQQADRNCMGEEMDHSHHYTNTTHSGSHGNDHGNHGKNMNGVSCPGGACPDGIQINCCDSSESNVNVSTFYDFNLTAMAFAWISVVVESLTESPIFILSNDLMSYPFKSIYLFVCSFLN